MQRHLKAYLRACSACGNATSGLEHGHTKCTSTVQMLPYSKLLLCESSPAPTDQQGRGQTLWNDQGRMGNSGEYLMDIQEKSLAQDVCVSEEYSSLQFRYFLYADFNTPYIQLYNHLNDKILIKETVCTMPSITRISFATTTPFITTIKQIN